MAQKEITRKEGVRGTVSLPSLSHFGPRTTLGEGGSQAGPEGLDGDAVAELLDGEPQLRAVCRLPVRVLVAGGRALRYRRREGGGSNLRWPNGSLTGGRNTQKPRGSKIRVQWLPASRGLDPPTQPKQQHRPLGRRVELSPKEGPGRRRRSTRRTRRWCRRPRGRLPWHPHKEMHTLWVKWYFH